MKMDYYEVLQVERTASDTELKASYRKLAMQYHPDRNPNNPDAEEKFKACSEAYQVLSDPDKRAAYDRYGHAGVGAAGAAGNPFARWTVRAGRSRRHLRRSLRRDVQHGQPRRPCLARPTRTRSQVRPPPRIRRGRLRHRARDQHPPRRGLQRLQRHRLRGRTAARDLPAVRRPRADSYAAGLLLRRAHLPGLLWHGLGRSSSVQDLPRRRSRAARAQDPRQGSGGRRERDAHPLLRRGRRRQVGRSVRRSLRRARGPCAQVLRARRRRPALRDAHQLSRRRRSEQSSKSKPSTAPRPSRSPKARRAARSSACAARASRT